MPNGEAMSALYKPNNYSTVSPYLITDGASATIDFLKRVFGAVELRRFPDEAGKLRHAEVRIEDTVIMLADPALPDWPPIPSYVHIYVRDVDTTYRRALEAGAVSVQEPIKKEDEDHWAARAGWDLTSERIAKKPDGLDLRALLDRIESEMGNAASEVQWTMNFCLAGIGIHFPKHRKRAIAIGEKLGIYRAYPVSKGCTSPFAPIWINKMVRLQN
jgi:uncharacterized glyoxalase superfamily protein PhnB